MHVCLQYLYLDDRFVYILPSRYHTRPQLYILNSPGKLLPRPASPPFPHTAIACAIVYATLKAGGKKKLGEKKGQAWQKQRKLAFTINDQK